MTDIRQPAGQPTGGQFAPHNRSDSEVKLSGYAPEPMIANITLEAWTDRDEIQTVGRVDIDVVRMLDAEQLSRVERLHDGAAYADWVFESADRAGLITDPHDGPFTVNFDEDDLRDYIDARRALGEEEPIAAAAAWVDARALRGDTTRHVQRVADEAGLGGIMPGVIDVLRDRESVSDEQIRSWTAADITGFYESLIAPAIDEFESRALER